MLGATTLFCITFAWFGSGASINIGNGYGVGIGYAGGNVLGSFAREPQKVNKVARAFRLAVCPSRKSSLPPIVTVGAGKLLTVTVVVV